MVSLTMVGERNRTAPTRLSLFVIPIGEHASAFAR
jgi:hypothetical protein